MNQKVNFFRKKTYKSVNFEKQSKTYKVIERSQNSFTPPEKIKI